MITLFLGNIGSGKTLSAVRQMALQNYKTFYTTIKTKKLKNVINITPEMIIKKEIVKYKKTKDGKETPVYDIKLNKEFWMNTKKPISVVLDEADDYLFARASMSKLNRLMSKFISMLRRVIGESSTENELIIISQLSRKLDIIAREMCHRIKYFIMHTDKECKRCHTIHHTTSQDSEPLEDCSKCGGHYFKELNQIIEVFHFDGIDAYEMREHHQHYTIDDCQNFFPYYSTYQFENLFEDFY